MLPKLMHENMLPKKSMQRKRWDMPSTRRSPTITGNNQYTRIYHLDDKDTYEQ